MTRSSDLDRPRLLGSLGSCDDELVAVAASDNTNHVVAADAVVTLGSEEEDAVVRDDDDTGFIADVAESVLNPPSSSTPTSSGVSPLHSSSFLSSPCSIALV